jgi:hypothetical protein
MPMMNDFEYLLHFFLATANEQPKSNCGKSKPQNPLHEVKLRQRLVSHANLFRNIDDGLAVAGFLKSQVLHGNNMSAQR